MWPVGGRRCRVDAYGVEDFCDSFPPFGPEVAVGPDFETLADDVFYPPSRVQRRDRVLEDHLEARPYVAQVVP